MARNKYYATIDRNGTEVEITVRTPSGRPLAFICFWDHTVSPEASQTKSDAKMIVDALNADRSQPTRN